MIKISSYLLSLHVLYFLTKENTNVLYFLTQMRHLKCIYSTRCGLQTIFRSSGPEVFCKKDVLRNFAKFLGKHLCQSLLFNKGTCNFIKKRLWHRCFSVNFAKIFKSFFLKEHLRCLLLKFKVVLGWIGGQQFLQVFKAHLVRCFAICCIFRYISLCY